MDRDELLHHIIILDAMHDGFAQFIEDNCDPVEPWVVAGRDHIQINSKFYLNRKQSKPDDC